MFRKIDRGAANGPVSDVYGLHDKQRLLALRHKSGDRGAIASDSSPLALKYNISLWRTARVGRDAAVFAKGRRK